MMMGKNVLDAAVKRTDSKRNKQRPSPRLSARVAFTQGIMRRRGNDRKMWRIQLTSAGVPRWVRASKK